VLPRAEALKLILLLPYPAKACPGAQLVGVRACAAAMHEEDQAYSKSS